MSTDDERGPRTALGVTTAEHAEESGEAEQRVYLDDGRQVAITRDGARQAVEIRAASGQLELRIRMTEDGPVLSLDAVKVELRASDVAIACDTFEVTATEKVSIASAGTTEVKAAGQIDVTSPEDVVVVGKHIRLN
jgi:hypothetical protein